MSRAYGIAVVILLAALMLAACAGEIRREAGRPVAGGRDYHIVRSGETVYGIAERYGLDYRDLAQWNRLGDGSLIYPGQRLRLGPSVSTKGTPEAADAERLPPPSRWQWPSAGEIEAAFGRSPRTASGILISGELGQPVRAAADGEIVYAGSGLAGYGQLLIVRHNAAWLSAYGHCQRLLVAEGQRVRRGDEVARMGEGPGRRAVVHFEIRRNGEPVDPLRYLPPRS